MMVEVGHCDNCKEEVQLAELRDRDQRCRKCVRDQNLWRTYGITLADFEQMLERQGGACAVCRRTNPNSKWGWCVDHNHVTGKVRGVLCTNCNTALGMLREDPVLFAAAVVYLSGHQVVTLNLKVRQARVRTTRPDARAVKVRTTRDTKSRVHNVLNQLPDLSVRELANRASVSPATAARHRRAWVLEHGGFSDVQTEVAAAA